MSEEQDLRLNRDRVSDEKPNFNLASSLMAKDDELDKLICDSRLTDADFDELATTLGLSLPLPYTERRVLISRELRHSYGHTVVNFFREWYDPDYFVIVKATAEYLKLPIKDHHSLENIEDKIMVEVIELVRQQLTKEKGPEAWQEVEKDLEKEVQKLVSEGKLPQDVLEQIKGLRGPALMAALVGGRMAGFALYMLANRVFFAVTNALALRVGVAVAGPIIGRSLAVILGPVGWGLTAAMFAYDLGNTNWKKIVPSVVMVISARRRLQFGALDEATVDSVP